MDDLKEQILPGIKCNHNSKEIFSFLSEKQKLKMIIYNKQLQEIFKLYIENYKRISRKYKIGGKNRKGKE